MKHALVVKVRLPEAAGEDVAQKMLDEVVVPQVKALAGFVHGVWMHDGTDGMGVVVFDSAAHAEAAKAVSNPPEGGPQLLSSTVYEVRAEA